MKLVQRVTILVVAAMALSAVSSAYYHFVHFSTRFGPFTPIVEKFDLNALPDKTVTFLITDQGPTKFADGDNYAAVVSQIRAAAKVWNDVETSELRVRFGGFQTGNVTQTTPGIDVTFDDLEPGVFGRGGPIVRNDLVGTLGNSFIPVQRSLVILQKDLSARASWSEGFFQTVVHEMGHAIGLQHTPTSGAMTMDLTRATTKAKPLGADDIAGVSVLYPTKAFKETLGSITGRVTLGGTAMNLASVVAISPNGPAIGAYTNPDGSYRIDGIPAGNYFIYVHALPPKTDLDAAPLNLILPKDNGNGTFDVGVPFDTVFYFGTRTPDFAIPVNPGQSTENVSFAVTRRTSLTVFNVQTYSFPGRFAVKPAHLNTGSSRYFLVANGTGLMQNGQPVAGLQLSFFNRTITNSGLKAYTPDYLQIDIGLSLGISESPGHLIFNRNNDVYILPNAFRIVTRTPPSIDTITAGTDSATAIVTGTGLMAETQILFDGVAAQTRSIDDQGRLTIVLPIAPGGYRASVVAINPDGQSSLFLQSPMPYTFDGVDNASIAVSNATLPAGAEAVIEINGINTNFFDGLTTVGFGSTDFFVKRVYVVSPTRLLVTASIGANTVSGTYSLRVSTGLRTINQSLGVTVGAPNARLLTIAVPTNVQAFQPGSTASLNVVNLPDLVTNPTLTIGDRQIPLISVLSGSITFLVPANLPIGPVLARLQYGTEVSLPIVINVAQLMQITSVIGGPGAVISETRPARSGELISLIVSSIPDALASPKQINISIAGIDHKPATTTQFGNALQLQFFLRPEVVTGVQPLTVTLDNLTTPIYNLPVQK